MHLLEAHSFQSNDELLHFGLRVLRAIPLLVPVPLLRLLRLGSRADLPVQGHMNTKPRGHVPMSGHNRILMQPDR